MMTQTNKNSQLFILFTVLGIGVYIWQGPVHAAEKSSFHNQSKDLSLQDLRKDVQETVDLALKYWERCPRTKKDSLQELGDELEEAVAELTNVRVETKQLEEQHSEKYNSLYRLPTEVRLDPCCDELRKELSCIYDKYLIVVRTEREALERVEKAAKALLQETEEFVATKVEKAVQTEKTAADEDNKNNEEYDGFVLV